MPIYRKDPAEELDYAIDWTAWLTTGDEIASATWTIADGLTQPKPSSIDGGTKAVVWLGGGEPGKTYPCTCTAVTTDDRIGERTITIVVSNR